MSRNDSGVSVSTIQSLVSPWNWHIFGAPFGKTLQKHVHFIFLFYGMDNNEIKVHFAVVFILFLDLRISIFRGKNVLSLSNCITSLI